MTEQNKNEVQEIKWREEFEKDYTSNALAKEVALGVLYYANPNIQAAWNGHLAGRKAARVEIDELTWLCENLSSDLKDRDQEISRLKAESVEVRGYNCDLANENRRIQEQCEILIESADCRGDEDCDHCEAVRVCKPCQLEIEIIEAMKKELGSLEQENKALIELGIDSGKEIDRLNALIKKKPMTVEEMAAKWPKLPPFEVTRIIFIDEKRAKDSFGFDLDQNSIQEIRDYLDAVEECLNG